MSSLMAALHAPVYEARLQELVRLIKTHLRAGDRVLDVGCGNGRLGSALMNVADVKAEGLERFPRGSEDIPVTKYNGGAIPFPDGAFDVVIVADVLHHDDKPQKLLAESARVAKRILIIKDHLVSGPLAQQRIMLLDWAANAPYGVRCTFRYNNLNEWKQWISRLDAQIVEERTSINLYPPIVNFFLGRRLHYFAALRKTG